MSKHNLLTEKDIKNYPLNSEIIRYLKEYKIAKKTNNSQIRILDWGCGKGEIVACLRNLGYSCYGVEINADYLENAKPHFEKKGWNYCDTLALIKTNGKTPFDDKYFDFIISDQVIEHVANPDITIKEIHRLTKPGGIGFHRYPPWGTFIEPHLFMPIIHWLPKNYTRKMAIALWMFFGIDPWKNQGRRRDERLDQYYQYSIKYTHFKTPYQIAKLFKNHNLNVKFVTIDNPKLKSYPIIYLVLSYLV